MRQGFLLLFTVLWLSAGNGYSQTITAALTGAVTDPSGAVIPEARVTATNTATNVANTTQSNSAGVYNFPFLPIGEYTVTAENPGFKKVILGPFRLEVNQIARVNISMEVGQITESVEVSAVAPVLQTETTQTGAVLSVGKMDSLPLNGRNFAALTLLIPGTISTNPQNMSNAGRFQSQGGRPYVNGNREQTNNFLLDGVDINDSIDNRIGYQPSVDALEEVKVLTGNAPAEFGNVGGAVVNAQLKSGTNAFHGNLFEYLRNDKLDANGFFSNRSSARKRALRRNIFGGTLGGPIRRDRLFFFLDYEGTREVDSGDGTASVALAEYRTGDLAKFPVVIRDPENKQPFAGNQIPQSRIVNPVSLALAQDTRLYPLPNRTGTGRIGVSSNFVGRSANRTDNDQGDIKIDWRATDQDLLAGRFSRSAYRSGGSQTVLPTQMASGQEGPTYTAVVNWTRTVTTSIVNELRLGFTRIGVDDVALDPTGLLGADGNQKLGIPGGQAISGASSVDMGDGLTAVGSAGGFSSTRDNKYQLSNNLTWARNRHLLKMGGQIIRFHQNRFYAGNNGVLGLFVFDGRYTGTPYADFLLNQLSRKGRGDLGGKWGHRHSRAGLFFQDDWKASSRLTVNLGLRWEFTQPVFEVADRQANIDLVAGRLLLAGKDGNSRALYEPYYRQFMPRIGFAWTPRSKTVIRAGYAFTSFMEGTGANLRLPLNPPFFFESDITYDLSAPGDIRTGFTDLQRPTLSQLSGQLRAWGQNLRPQFNSQWNLSLENQLSPTISVTAAYVGQKGTQLVVPREGNQPMADPGPMNTWRPLQQRRPLYGPLPGVTNIATTDSAANMDYHALQITGRKRMAGGLEFLTSYTLSKTLTDNRGFYGGGGYIAGEGAYWQNAYDRRSDRGPAFFDARHNFNFGGRWELPFGRNRAWGKDWNRAADLILGGWSGNFILLSHSGFPVTILGRDQTNQAVRGFVRANRYRALTYQNQSIDNWFGTGNTICAPGLDDGKCAYGDPAVGQFGTAAVGTEKGPSFTQFDCSVGKRFPVTENNYLDFRVELFNAFNHVSFGPPGRAANTPSTFGQITSQTTRPRNIQFALKYYF